MIAVLAGVAGLLAGIGLVQALYGARLVGRFSREQAYPAPDTPRVTILKPLHGDEPMLKDALHSLCQQSYTGFQIVFGVQDPDDPAVSVVRQLQRRFPSVDMVLVVDPTLHGRNRKVSNLINMLPSARYDVIVIADSDVHARGDYLHRLVAALAVPGVGLVTTLYAGVPVSAAWPAQLGALEITHRFLPGAVLARALGRRDCLGATMCLRRNDLARIGGLEALVDHLADDNVLGRRIQRLGLQVGLAETVVMTTVPETNMPALFRHELRWARTIRALEPAGFAASVLQYPLFWAALASVLSGFSAWSLLLFGAAWLLRALAVFRVNQSLAKLWAGDFRSVLAFSSPVWLLPVRDALSVVVMLASYAGRRVDWQGYALHADSPARSLDSGARSPGPTEDTRPR